MLTRAPGRADRDPAADGRLAQERGRHQDGRRRDRAGVRARLHHDVRDRHRRQRLHAARAQAARAEQARDRHRRRGVDVGAAPARVRRVPVLRPARGRRRPVDRRDAAAPAGRRAAQRAGKPEPERRASDRGSPARRRPRRAGHPDARRARSAAPTVRCSRRRSSARSCARTRRSARPTTGSAASASCCATSPSAASSSCAEGSAQGDPEVHLPVRRRRRRTPRSRCSPTSVGGSGGTGPAALRSQEPAPQAQPDFSEKRFGYGGFLSFVRAARAQGLLDMEWDDTVGDYRLHIAD